MTNLEYATRYASLGWRVFPCYEINTMGKCSCNKPDCHSPGKHPRTKNGLIDSTTDQKQITEWWNRWPTANIAVATGAGSGLVVIDIDGEQGEESIKAYDYPPTIEALTGGGGRHLVYAHPGDCAIKSGAGILPKVDSRADGGYIIAPPSNHISGNEYEWRSAPWDDYPTAAPDWWLDLLIERKEKKKEPFENAPVMEGGRNNHLAKYAGKLRRTGFDYEEMLGAVMVHNNKFCNPPLDDDEVTQICRSIAGYAIFTPEEEELIARGDKYAKVLLDNLDRERMEALKNPKKVITKPKSPDLFVPSSGILREVYDWIINTSRYPLPYLAMAASVSFVSILIGRKFATHTNMRPNMYIIGLAESGAGKDHARNCIANLMVACGLNNILGGSKIASGAGLVSAVEECPVKLYQIDEIGLMLQTLFDKNAGGHKKELAELMMELYTTNNYTGTDYADRKTKKQSHIIHPFLSIYGTSTPSEFYKSLSSGSAASGFLNRMLFIADEKKEKHRDRFPNDPPWYLIESIKKFYESIHGDLDGALTGSHIPIITRVKCPDDIADSWEELDDSLQSGKYDEIVKPIYTRVPASVMKLATIFSLSRGAMSIQHEDYAMAREIVLWSTALIVDGMVHNVADNDTERKAKKLANIIRNAGQISKSDIIHKTRWLQKWERDQILQDLLDAGKIEPIQTDTATKTKMLINWIDD
jgi:hypothetical protein